MRTLFAICLLPVLAFAQPKPASQAEVDAGARVDKYVTPANAKRLATAQANAASSTSLTASNTIYGIFIGDGTGITGITAESTNNSALYATNDPAGTAILMANKLNATNASVVNTLMVIGANNQDPPVFIARASSAQSTNRIIQAQDSSQNEKFGVAANGGFVFHNAPTNATGGTNTVFWMIVTNKGTAYVLPLHLLADPP